MTEYSRPQSGLKWTDIEWRNANVLTRGIVEDYAGDAYALFLPPDSNSARLGSAVNDSVAQLMGCGHVIPAGDYHTIDVPAAVGSNRTDLLVLRYSPAWAASTPGPVRLTRLENTPATGYNAQPDPSGNVDLPLYAVTRTPGQSLSDATVVDLRQWAQSEWHAKSGAILPFTAPLGTKMWRGNSRYDTRILSGGSTPAWREPPQPRLFWLGSNRFTRWSNPIFDNSQRNIFWTDVPEQVEGPGIYQIRTRVEFAIQGRIRLDLQLYAGNLVALPLLRDVAITEKKYTGASNTLEHAELVNPMTTAYFTWPGGPLRIVCAAQRIWSGPNNEGGWKSSQFNGWCEVVFHPQHTSAATQLNNNN